jgi:catechol 2,3-dioxygenase-like lactoylglutathione lyase family enzyme
VEPHVDVLTLGVGDLERALAFYRALGLESSGLIGTEFVGDETTPAGAAAMFELRRGLALMLYPRSELAKDASWPLEPGTGAFSIGHLVGSKAEVDAVLARAEAAGATLTDEAHERPWGIYSGYFRDPDGHLWEIIWNPRWSGDAA